MGERLGHQSSDSRFFLTHPVKAIEAAAVWLGIGYDSGPPMDSCRPEDLVNLSLREISDRLQEVKRLRGEGENRVSETLKEAGVNLTKRC